MFTLWYAYLGYQEYRRRGLSVWLKLDSTQNSSKFVMDSASVIGQPEKSDTLYPGKQNENLSSVSVNNQSTSELSTPASNRSVNPTVSEYSEDYDGNTPSAEPDSSLSLSDKSKTQVTETSSETGYISDEELSDEDEPVLNAKDSRLLLTRRSSTEEEVVSDGRLSQTKGDKKKISFNDSGELTNETTRPEESRDMDDVIPVSPTRSTNGRLFGRMLVEGADEPMRCWMTEGDHPQHPAGSNMCANIKMLSNRAKTSADSILRDEDEFISGERRVTKQISWPKKVSISDEPPTTFIRDIPPAEIPEPDQDTDQPVTKIKSEAELAAAAAAALKEDWRKKTDLETKDLEDDDKIIFGDSYVVDDGQILQISDDETSDSGPKEDIK